MNRKAPNTSTNTINLYSNRAPAFSSDYEFYTPKMTIIKSAMW